MHSISGDGMTFKEMEAIIKYLVALQKRQEVWEVSEGSMRTVIDLAMLTMSEDEQHVFKHEFIIFSHKYWWEDYYSKSNFYRVKKSAMVKFVRCLKA